MLKRARVCAWAVSALFLMAAPAESFVLISEVLADPPSIGGDANQDGIISSSGDEFVELYNVSEDQVDLAGWSIHDALAERHVFGAGSIIGPWSTVVVFGGSPALFAAPSWYKASNGGLNLNNTGDIARLYDPQKTLIDEFRFGAEGGRDVSLIRVSPRYDAKVTVSLGEAFSPGRTDYPLSMAVPEPATWSLFIMAFSLAGGRLRKSNS
jgi:hypothetical protein